MPVPPRSPRRARRERGSSRSLQKFSQRGPGKVTFRKKAARPARLDQGSVRRTVTTRHEHDLELRIARQEAFRNCEAVQVGKLDVEEDEVRSDLARESDCGCNVLCFR